MGVDDFFTDVEREQLEELDFKIRPNDANTDGTIQKVTSVAIEVADACVTVDLDEPTEIDLMDDDPYKELGTAVMPKLSSDRLWQLYNHKADLVSDDAFTPIIDADDDRLKILMNLSRMCAGTKAAIEEDMEYDPTNYDYTKLRELNMISHVLNKGNAHVYTITPRGVREVLARKPYEQDVETSDEDDSDENEADEDSSDESVPEDIQVQQTLKD
jgi:hypothetical protein